MSYLGKDFFERETVTVAQGLIGARLIVGACEGRIVEAEAYTTDAASHAVTRRNQASSMRDTYGHVYVYFTYGMYHCLNFTTERDGIGAVLIRAVEPLKGVAEMARRRGTTNRQKLASGPGMLCQAFGIDLSFNGEPLGKSVKLRERSDTPAISASTRIGISQATGLMWRFYETGNSFVSAQRKANIRPGKDSG
ncbi:MAG TPA: DNA-3-methyladenine glycosylase, partial [Blastocatellia bacterium]|nr:DNA-3-methyladenine glycosylase [Blastocatellia bacterium]